MEREMSMPTPNTGPHSFQMPGWISCAPFEKLLNISIIEASEGHAVLTMPFLIDYAQGAGLMHGGALVSLADTAVVMAIKSLLDPQTHFATIALDARYLLPVKQGVITAKARIIGKEDRIIKGHAILSDEGNRPVMEFNSTFKIAKDAKIKNVIIEEYETRH